MDELNEPILKDDYPVYGGYSYVADGEPVVCPLERAKVADLKKALGAKEIRRCDIVGRGIEAKKSTKKSRAGNTAMGKSFKKLGLL